MAGPFSGPDSSHRPIRHAGPSGHSRSPRPAVHPPTFGTRSGRLSIRPHPETLPAICPSCLAEPLPAVRPSGPSKTIFARSPPRLPEPRPPIRLLTPGTPSAQERTVRNASGYTATPFVRPLQRFARSRPIRPPHLGSTRFRPSESHKKSDPGIALDSGITR